MFTPDPEAAGFSAQRLQRLDTAMQDFVKDDQMPGIMTLVQRKGKIAHFNTFGHMNIEQQKPIAPDNIFRIYSMTKPITSIAALMLIEEGRLSIKDPVANYIPTFEKTKVFHKPDYTGMKLVEQETPMNIHHLLTHTAGLSYGAYQHHPVEDLYRQISPEIFQRERPLSETMELLASLPLMYQPGTVWHYSFATDVLGYLVEVIADMPFADFLQERIFEPLGMVDTAFHVPQDKMDRLAQLYYSEALYDPKVNTNVHARADVTAPTLSPSGGGGLVSTLSDYLAFCDCLVNGGAPLISRKTLDWMTTNHIPASMFPLQIGGRERFGYGFGLGVRVMIDLGKADRLTSIGEYGWGGAASTYFWIDPQEDMFGILMTQYMPTDPYPAQNRFQTLLYQALL